MEATMELAIVKSQTIDRNADLETQKVQLEYLIHNPPPVAIRITLSTDMLRYILEEKNGVNRPMRMKVVKEIRAEGYRFIGGIISFGTHGLMTDGQNRSQACLDLEQEMDTFVAFGIPLDAFPLIDSGAKRDLADACKIQGIGGNSYKEAASVIRWIMNLKETWEGDKFVKRYRTTQEAIRFYGSDIRPHWFNFCVANAVEHNRRIQAGYLGAVLYHFWAADKGALATQFVNDLTRQKKRSRAVKLSNQIGWNLKRDDHGHVVRVEANVQLAWIIQAIKGEPPNWYKGQDFPVIKPVIK